MLLDGDVDAGGVAGDAKSSRLVATPGRDAGGKVTVPSRAEVAVAACVASKLGWSQRPWGGQAGVQA